MESIGVLVIPETKGYEFYVSHQNIVWVNKNLGKPNLSKHNAKYLAPLWIDEGVVINRIYHIINDGEAENTYTFKLGNSFILNNPYTEVNQKRAFSYLNLKELNLAEITDGLLLNLDY